MESRRRTFLNAVYLSFAGLMALLVVAASAFYVQKSASQVGELPDTHIQVSAKQPQEVSQFTVREQRPAADQEDQNRLLSRQLKSARAHAAAHRLSGRSGAVLVLAGSPWQAFTATWYSPQGGVGAGETTASGTHVKDGWTIAVDPRLIPLGSIVEIRFPDGHTHTYQALDTGGAISGHRLDIFEDSEDACVQNGVQHVLVRILQKGTTPKGGNRS